MRTPRRFSLDRGVELALEAELLAFGRGDAPLARFVQRRVGDADGRHDEDAVLRGVELLDRLLIGEGRVEDDLDAVAQAHLDRFR